MRRLLSIAIVAALLVACFVGVASARRAGPAEGASSTSAAVEPAPFRNVPVAMPAADRHQPGAYGFRSSNSIGADLEADAARAAASGAAPDASATAAAAVHISATILPVVIISLDDDGSVVELTVNTDQRDPRDVLYVVRDDRRDGESAAMTADLWQQVRAAMLDADAGVGAIWRG